MDGFRCRVFALLSLVLVTAIRMRPSAQSGHSLAALTVPGERLPDGCRLEPVVLDATGASRFVMYPGVKQNPWLGSGGVAAAAIRQVVDGPDGPDYGLPHGPQLHARLAEDVVESYRARYISANQQRIEVYAVRFKDPALTRAALLNPLRADGDRRPRIRVGSAAILVFLSGTATRSQDRNAGERCRRAIADHITQLANAGH